MSFPPGTEMFQFPGFASPKLCIHFGDTSPIKPVRRLAPVQGFNGEGGFPHSEICGSKVAHTSPKLIAACHVLHRLCMPRHPRIALTSRLRIHTINDNFGTRIVDVPGACIKRPSQLLRRGATTQLDKDLMVDTHLSRSAGEPPDR